MFPFSQLNYLLNGGELDRISLITSSTDNGKSTISSQIICDVIKQGYNCACYFGEDSPYESQDRIFKQSTYGNENDMYYQPYYANGKQTNCGEWVLTKEAYQRAKENFAGRLFLYNTNASSKVDDILDGFEEARVNYGCRVFLLDNCDVFDFTSENENKAMKDIILKIRDYAINKKVHIFLICHLRKLESGKVLASLDDVKGTSSIVNISKNVIIVTRMDNVDKESKEYKALKRTVELNNYNLDEADSLLYVAKTKGRKLGFVCLKYNRKTNTYYECKKIDESKEETERAEVIVRQKPTLVEVDDDEPLPF
jgi:twinkle protein